MHHVARARYRNRVFLDDAGARALRQQINRVRQADRLFEIVGHQKHAQVLAFDQVDQVLDDPGTHDGVERGERLVHQEQPRLARQNLGKSDTLALAAAQVPGEPVAETGKAKALEPPLGRIERRPPLDAIKNQAEGDVIAGGAPGQQRVVLKQDPDLGARKSGFHQSGQRPLQSDDGAQNTGFARAGRPDQADELRVVNLQARALDNRDVAVRNGKITDAQDFNP